VPQISSRDVEVKPDKITSREYRIYQIVNNSRQPWTPQIRGNRECRKPYQKVGFKPVQPTPPVAGSSVA
jgi:hypothetical protein